MKRALITGIAGFAGSYLAEHLIESGWEVAGLERLDLHYKNLEGIADRVRVEECDILQEQKVARVVRRWKPDTIFHLAGLAFIPSAENSPQMAFEVHGRGTLNLLEACRKYGRESRVIIISSAEVYGSVPRDKMPISERTPLHPVNIYGATKLCAEELAAFYRRAYSLAAIVLRPFNHIGPRQNPRFVTADFARQIARIEAGKKKPVLQVGNLEAARDFTDIRDMVRAYRLAAEKCDPGVIYNICSGRAYTIQKILDKLLGMTERRIEVKPEEKRLRKAEVPLTRGDSSRFRKKTGWKPQNTIDSSLKNILDYWRKSVQN